MRRYADLASRAAFSLVRDGRVPRVPGTARGAARARQWHAAAVRAEARRRLETLFAAARTAPFYDREPWREHLAAGTPRDLGRLTELPLIGREELRRRTERFASTVHDPRALDLTFTSGTGGAPTHLLRPRHTELDQGACESRWYDGLGLHGVFDLTSVTPWPGAGRANAPLRDVRVAYHELGARDVLRRLREGRPVGDLLLSSPDVLELLDQRAPGWGGVRAVASSFEVMRRAPANGGAPPLAEMYCAAEVTAPIAFSYPGCAGMHVNADYVHVEVVGPGGEPLPPGRAGAVVVTDLVNTAMPVLRYRIGDAGTLRGPDACPCGRALPVLRVHGRLTDAVRGGNGRAPVAGLRPVLGEGTLLEQRSATGFVLHGEGDLPARAAAAAEPLARAVGAEAAVEPCPGCADGDRGETGCAFGGDLAAWPGAVLVSAPRYPVDRHLDGPAPARWSYLDAAVSGRTPGPGPDRGPGPRRSARHAARLLLRDRYAAEGRVTAVPIVDTSRSMDPLVGAGTEVVVRWGRPDPAGLRGRIVLLQLPQDLLAAHRVADLRTVPGGGIEILQFADNHDPHNPFSRFWVPIDDVLGTVTALRTARGRTVDLDTPAARLAGRLVAAADRAVAAAAGDRPHRPGALPALLAQKTLFRLTSRLLHSRSRP